MEKLTEKEIQENKEKALQLDDNFPKRHQFIISIKWNKNDNGGDIRSICIDYLNQEDKKAQIAKILNDFRTNPMDIGENKGKVPYSVSTSIPNFKKW